MIKVLYHKIFGKQSMTLEAAARKIFKKTRYNKTQFVKDIETLEKILLKYNLSERKAIVNLALANFNIIERM